MRKITLLTAALAISLVAMAQAMSGTYKVGTTEVSPNFTSLSAAVAALNTNGVSGDVILEITSDITESANIGLGVNTNGFGITIRPDADADRTITFTKLADNTSPSGHFVIGYTDLTKAWSDANTIATNNVTIDGYAVGGTTRRLKFTTANVSITASKLTVIVGSCQNTTIKNCIYDNKSTGASAQCIGMVSRKGTAIEVSPNGVVIENNIITSLASLSGQGLNTTSSGTLTAAKTTGLVVKNNIITAQGRAAWFYYINGLEFSNNEVHLTQLGNAATVNYGLWTSTGAAGTFNIYNNKFVESTTMEGSASGTYGLRTLSLAAGTYNIYNNMFAGANRKVNATATVNLTYIFFGGTAGTIYNNTFYMPSLTSITTPGYYQAITLSFANPIIKNNIFISNEDAVVNSFFGSVTTQACDNNVFFNRAGNTKSLFVSATTNSTFATYQTANPTKDINSKNVDVNFTNAATGDLSITGASIGDWQLAVPKQATVLTDIDGSTRADLTYVGADEATTDLTTVTKQFKVTVPKGTSKVYVAGSFTGKNWEITDPFALKATGSANEFGAILPCVDGVEYKYLCEKGDWDYQEAVFDGSNPPLEGSNRSYSANDNVPIWFRVNKITLNATFATAVPNTLFVKGSFDAWAAGHEMTKNGSTYSIVLGGNAGDKYPANTEYKYYTNDMNADNWESNSDGSNRDNRWAIAPVMDDEIARFVTAIPGTGVDEIQVTARIMRTVSGIEVVLDGEANIELYSINGALLDKTVANSNYSKALNSGIYIIRVNGVSTKFVK